MNLKHAIVTGHLNREHIFCVIFLVSIEGVFLHCENTYLEHYMKSFVSIVTEKMCRKMSTVHSSRKQEQSVITKQKTLK